MSGKISTRLVFRGRQFEDVRRRVKLGLSGGASKRVVKVVDEETDLEFGRGVWSAPDGSLKPWPPRHPLNPSTRPRLGGVGGRIRKSIKLRPSQTGAVVFGSRLIYAAVHRGGAGGNVGFGITRIRPKRIGSDGKSFMGKVLHGKGIHMNDKKLRREGVKIRHAPFLTRSPRKRRAANLAIKTYLLEGK